MDRTRLFKKFFSWPASTGIVLLFSALLALLWANSAYYNLYEKIQHYPLGFHWQGLAFSFSLHHWVNDGLMAIFFFVVGLEIKKEMAIGELSSVKKALLPIFSAIGGMLVPALFYLAFNGEGLAQRGWGIPMATDIAFAVGALSLISKRIPVGLKVFLLALAIVDDLGAVLVIAIFYSKSLSFVFLTLSALMACVVFGALRAGLKSRIFYISCGLGLWFFVLKSGVHATVAGVVLGLMCPARSHSSYSPAGMWIKTLSPFVDKLIMPLFAFFNAGVKIGSDFSFMEFLSHPVSLGIFGGLLLGKPLGILLFSYLALKMKWAVWPQGFNWRRLTGVGFLAGIGFTMALFISHLSFESQPYLMYSKLSILLASLLAMLIGLSFLIFSSPTIKCHIKK